MGHISKGDLGIPAPFLGAFRGDSSPGGPQVPRWGILGGHGGKIKLLNAEHGETGFSKNFLWAPQPLLLNGGGVGGVIPPPKIIIPPRGKIVGGGSTSSGCAKGGENILHEGNTTPTPGGRGG